MGMVVPTKGGVPPRLLFSPWDNPAREGRSIQSEEIVPRWRTPASFLM